MLTSRLGMGLLLGRRGGAAGFAGAYDDIPNLVHVYEIARRTLTSYTGNLVRLRRDSDNAEKDFSYDSNGDLDTAAISTWLGGASGYAVTVYDQVNSDDATQATAANQPLYVASMQNGKPGLRFDGTNDYLQGAFTNGGALSQPIALFAAAKLDADVVNDNASICTIVDGNHIANRASINKHTSPDPDAWRIATGSAVSGSAADSDWHVFSALFNGASSELWLDGTSDATGDTGSGAPADITVGAAFNESNFWKGNIITNIVVDASLSAANRQALETAINSYYAIF